MYFPFSKLSAGTTSHKSELEMKASIICAASGCITSSKELMAVICLSSALRGARLRVTESVLIHASAKTRNHHVLEQGGYSYSRLNRFISMSDYLSEGVDNNFPCKRRTPSLIFMSFKISIEI
jgi:hypothetical protein